MDDRRSAREWQRGERVASIHSPWMDVVVERFIDDENEELVYWRIEKADSMLLVVVAGERLLLPAPSFRPGIGEVTLDLAGGRYDGSLSLEAFAHATVVRELGIAVPVQALHLRLLQSGGWPIDSSTSNQRLFVAEVRMEGDWERVGPEGIVSYAADQSGVAALLEEVTCLQCRMAVLHWQATSSESLREA